MGSKPRQNLLITEIPLKTAEELMDEITPQSGKHLGDSTGWFFRGQRDAKWKLQPSVMREEALVKYGNDLGELPPKAMTRGERRSFREFQLVNHFATRADEHGYHLPGDTPEFRLPGPIVTEDFPPVRWRGIWALAQHYGVPTRFLDWTRRPLVGAYFACNEAAEEHPAQPERFALWALNKLFIKHHLEPPDLGVTLIGAPSALIPNLRAQGGVFTLVRCRDEALARTTRIPNLDDLVKSIQPQPGMLLGLMKFSLPRSQAGRLLRMLASLDVTAASVFPGLHSVERAMYERTLFQQ